jgi:hypothetical protein
MRIKKSKSQKIRGRRKEKVKGTSSIITNKPIGSIHLTHSSAPRKDENEEVFLPLPFKSDYNVHTKGPANRNKKIPLT